MTQTQQHTRCADEQCTRTVRDAIEHGQTWHKITGWTTYEGREVAGSWAEACPEHQAQTADAVRTDVEDYPGPWRVTTQSLTYGTNEPGETTQHSNGDGTTGTLF
jgi:hypothetical protein